jgi:hypothetical protein
LTTRFPSMTILGQRQQDAPPPTTAYVEAAPAPAAPTDWTTYALIGGGVLLAGSLAYFAWRK